MISCNGLKQDSWVTGSVSRFQGFYIALAVVCLSAPMHGRSSADSKLEDAQRRILYILLRAGLCLVHEAASSLHARKKKWCTCTSIPLPGGSSTSQGITECISFAANLAQFGGCKGCLGFEWDFTPPYWVFWARSTVLVYDITWIIYGVDIRIQLVVP